MSSEAKDYSLHLVGLGGTGANVLESFLKYPGVNEFLRQPGVRLSLLALDVADHDVLSLQKTYDKFVVELREKGIPSDRVSLIAKSVKFPTPEAMFDFIERFPEFLKQEGGVNIKDYRPWLSSAIDIPPLSGGVGRRRALSKGIYCLNYYYLKLIENYVENFKEKVASSTLQPIIWIVFGLGGGSGGGMAVDFVRHLRKKLGKGFPIMGLAILPCQGDDPPARGASAYAAMLEFELMLNRDKNRKIMEAYGQIYENPFSGFLLMPLGPPFSQTGSMAQAKVHIDDAIADMLVHSIRFDLADLLANIGASQELADRWVHTVNALRITYPINEYIAITKLHLSFLDRLRSIRKDRLEICLGTTQGGTGGLTKILQQCRDELSEVFQSLLKEKNSYDINTFDQKVKERIYEDKNLEVNYNMQVNDVKATVVSGLMEVARPVMSIGLQAAEGTTEARIRKLVEEIVKVNSDITRTHTGYHAFAERVIDDLNTTVGGAQKLTVKQKLLLNDLSDYVKLVDVYLLLLRSYFEVKSFAEGLLRELSGLEKNDEHKEALQKIQRINPELNSLLSLLSGVFSPSTTQIKSVDNDLTAIRVIRRPLSEQLEKAKSDVEMAEARIRSYTTEREKLMKERAGIKAPWSGRKKFLYQKIQEIDRNLTQIKVVMEEGNVAFERVNGRLSEYSAVEKKLDVNSEYRKILGEAIDLSSKEYEGLNHVSKDRGYYDRVAEIGEEERQKIMQRIISDEEASLTRENILREIVDRNRLNEYLVGVMKIFRIPGTLGVKSSYRTDYIWVTVAAPRGVWDQDLSSELKVALSAYIAGDASRSITIREIDSREPWTIRLMVIAGKSRIEDLEISNDMKNLYDGTAKGDRVLAHSFLLEHGVLGTAGLEGIKTEGLTR